MISLRTPRILFHFPFSVTRNENHRTLIGRNNIFVNKWKDDDEWREVKLKTDSRKLNSNCLFILTAPYRTSHTWVQKVLILPIKIVALQQTHQKLFNFLPSTTGSVKSTLETLRGGATGGNPRGGGDGAFFFAVTLQNCFAFRFRFHQREVRVLTYTRTYVSVESVPDDCRSPQTNRWLEYWPEWRE